jgi:hypothetical protein
VEHGVGQLRRLVERLAAHGIGRAKGDAVEAELGEGRREAVVDQGQFGRGRRTGEFQEFKAVADGAHRAYQVVAEAGADQCAQVGRHHARCPCEAQVMDQYLEPGMLVRHPDRPDWGLGQVQSVIDGRITVNFEHAGKVVIDGSRIGLVAELGPHHGS